MRIRLWCSSTEPKLLHVWWQEIKLWGWQPIRYFDYKYLGLWFLQAQKYTCFYKSEFSSFVSCNFTAKHNIILYILNKILVHAPMAENIWRCLIAQNLYLLQFKQVSFPNILLTVLFFISSWVGPDYRGVYQLKMSVLLHFNIQNLSLWLELQINVQLSS